MIKALWITSWYPNRYSPENGDFVKRMAEAVSAYCNIIVLNLIEAECKGYEIVCNATSVNEVLVYYPKINSKLPKIVSNILKLFRYCRAFSLAIRKIHSQFPKLDLIHLHVLFPAGYVTWFYKLWTRLPLVVTEHWTGYSSLNRKELKYYHKLPANLCLKDNTKVLPVSLSLKDDMQRLGFRGNYEIVPNVIDLDLFAPIPKSNINTTNFTFLHVSSLKEEVKNVSGIIRAFSTLVKEYSNVQLLIIGSGPDLAYLRLLAEKKGITNKLFFRGQLDYFSIAKAMQDAHAFVLFSNVETFSCVLLEAMSVGLPIISSKCGGIVDWISEEEGIIISPKDENSLKLAMQEMIENYQHFNPGLRREVVNKCGKKEVGSRIMKIYESIFLKNC